ncbi:hypothetical protein [Muricauda sp. MAR_2010_75]|uniref:hypothetical protein n=1 Tax=Allomuricauda sp. MAR_2010_75 TaxID=1250232 RepID=UPI00055C61D0|nr:hypothetical protein [Muricauda sp. MAR_2010_75]
MKVLAVILSLLTILLSSYPCCQETDSCSEELLVGQSGHDDSDEPPLSEDSPCSPFYTCGRCPGFTIRDEAVDFIYLEVDKETPPMTYLELLPKEVYFFSLKPPRTFGV